MSLGLKERTLIIFHSRLVSDFVQPQPPKWWKNEEAEMRRMERNGKRAERMERKEQEKEREEGKKFVRENQD